MRKLVIDIYRIDNKLHQFDFDIDEAFFSSLEQDLISSGRLTARIDLEKNDTFIGMSVNIEGTVELICDRSLEPFDYPIKENRKVIFKYGDDERELDHDVIMITGNTQQIDAGQYIFEFIGLAVPMKKLHPRYDEQDNEQGSLVYSSRNDGEPEYPSEPDPRWKKLKDLRKN